MAKQFKGKVALVTGASSGIGKAVALRLAEMGVVAYGASRRVDEMKDLADKGVRILPLDLTDEKSIEACHSSRKRPKIARRSVASATSSWPS